ncbi:hypothetical protein GLA29479_4591 [Lysobacter antibioticus]|uniref:Uncharacterized protein n=1 Tax=Lysobacter antibioticus TaxID=84531 RepID=A0A0S2FFC1_LYSAN|nr:hypothetical protein GLA29479_4591 [Lysobacter antibioticus]ALN82203.1 hypothetical protein LA76x_4087 [Lysobacter antibioticus]
MRGKPPSWGGAARARTAAIEPRRYRQGIADPARESGWFSARDRFSGRVTIRGRGSRRSYPEEGAGDR